MTAFDHPNYNSALVFCEICILFPSKVFTSKGYTKFQFLQDPIFESILIFLSYTIKIQEYCKTDVFVQNIVLT